jgi:dTMP kinase
MSLKKNRKNRGIFLTFEGGEGGGKSTQIRLLEKAYLATGREIIVTREPGGNPIADRIRDLLLSKELNGVVPLAELFLYQASRAQHVAELIEPALARGAIVICDRFADSSVVYQGVGRGLGKALVAKLNTIACQGRKPDLTFILDLDPRVGLVRVGKRAELDRIESEKISFHQAVRRGFLALAKAEPRRCRVLDARLEPQILAQEIEKTLRRRGLLK